MRKQKNEIQSLLFQFLRYRLPCWVVLAYKGEGVREFERKGRSREPRILVSNLETSPSILYTLDIQLGYRSAKLLPWFLFMISIWRLSKLNCFHVTILNPGISFSISPDSSKFYPASRETRNGSRHVNRHNTLNGAPRRNQ